MMCRLLKVSRSGYYDYLVREQSPTQQKREQIVTVIADNYKDENEIPGYRKIYQRLKYEGQESIREAERKLFSGYPLVVHVVKYIFKRCQCGGVDCSLSLGHVKQRNKDRQQAAIFKQP